jgi:hypothetical protein
MYRPAPLVASNNPIDATAAPIVVENRVIPGTAARGAVSSKNASIIWAVPSCAETRSMTSPRHNS